MPSESILVSTIYSLKLTWPIINCFLRRLILSSSSLWLDHRLHTFSSTKTPPLDFKSTVTGTTLHIHIPALGHFHKCEMLDWSDNLCHFPYLWYVSIGLFWELKSVCVWSFLHRACHVVSTKYIFDFYFLQHGTRWTRSFHKPHPNSTASWNFQNKDIFSPIHQNIKFKWKSQLSLTKIDDVTQKAD